MYFIANKLKSIYNRLQLDLDWEAERDGACYLVALDKDKRHSMSDMQHYRYTRRGTGRGELRDRRHLDKHTEGWIQLQEKQIVPAGPKQCDTVQQPVELVIDNVIVTTIAPHGHLPELALEDSKRKTKHTVMFKTSNLVVVHVGAL